VVALFQSWLLEVSRGPSVADKTPQAMRV
jgi:hypothetical protein